MLSGAIRQLDIAGGAGSHEDVCLGLFHVLHLAVKHGKFVLMAV
jgi:hypothetical protein